MQRTVDILLVIGILVNLIKGADLVLRPHQQKWLQKKFESLALWLDYTKPLKWYMSLVHKKVYSVLFFTAPFIVIALPLAPSIVKSGIAPLWWGVFVVVFGIIATIVTIASAFGISNLEDDLPSERPPFYDVLSLGQYWLINSDSFAQQLLRHLLVVATSVGLWLIISSTKTNIFGKGGFLIEILNGIVFLTFCFITWGFAASSFLIIIFVLILLAAEVMLKFFRGLVWRIVEYNKGAFAAIVLIVTIVLGVTEFYLKYHPPAAPQAAPYSTK